MKNNIVCSVKLARVDNFLRYFIRKIDPPVSLNVQRKEHSRYGCFSSFIKINRDPFYILDVALAEDELISGTKKDENLAALAFSDSFDLNDELISGFSKNNGINFSDETPNEILQRAKNIFLPRIHGVFDKYS